jgi:hypothetical protein
MQAFGNWLLALVDNWRVLLGGGGTGGAVLLIVQVAEWLEWFKLKKWLKIFLIIWCFILGASFMAWQDAQTDLANETNKYNSEHQSLLEAEDTSEPKLEVKIGTMMAAHNGLQQAVLTLVITVVNHGAPSVVSLDKVSVVTRNGNQFLAKMMIPTGKDVLLSGAQGNPNVILHANDHFPERAMNSPTPQGGATVGWIMFVIPEISQQELEAPGTQVVVECSDVNGKSTSAERTFTNEFGNAYNPTKPYSRQ